MPSLQQPGFRQPLSFGQISSHFQSHTQASPIFFDDLTGFLTHSARGQLSILRARRRPLSNPSDSHSRAAPQPAPHLPFEPHLPLAPQAPFLPHLSPQSESHGDGSQGNRVGGMQIVLVSIL